MRTAALLIFVVLASCWHGHTSTEPAESEADKTRRRDQWDTDSKQTKQDHREAQQVQFLKDSEPTEDTTVPGTYIVAGCNTGCNGCAIGGKTDVHGIDVQTGKELFPHPNGGTGGGISCSAALPLNTRVRLVAKSAEGLVLDTWRPFNKDDYCPCAGSNKPVCDVVVTKEIAAKFARAYCGADWKPQGAAQIGH